MSRLTQFFKFLIPGYSDQGKIISECIEPNFEKIDNELHKTNEAVDNKVSKAGDTMTGQLIVPFGIGVRTNVDPDNGQFAAISNESGYAMLWRYNNSPTKASEFIGITKDSKLVFRKDDGTGNNRYNDYLVYHQGNKPTPSDIGAVSDDKLSSGQHGSDWSKYPIPIIYRDGVMEIGKYIDFHEISNDTSDYASRLESSGNFLYLVNNSGKGKIYSELNKPTANDVKALSINGGSLQGNLSLGANSLYFAGEDCGDIAFNGADGKEKGRIYTGVTDNSLTIRGAENASRLVLANNGAYIYSTNGLKVDNAIETKPLSGLVSRDYTYGGETYHHELSSESGYTILWRKSQTKANQFIGISQDSKVIFRKDNGRGDRTSTDYELLYSENLASKGSNYIIFKNGYKECWGEVTLYNDETTRNISLPVRFSDNNYSIQIAWWADSEKYDIVPNVTKNGQQTLSYRNNHMGTDDNSKGTGKLYYKVTGY